MTQHTATVSRPHLASPPGWRTWYLTGVAAVTLYSAGVGWQAQFVSYPLYRAVSGADFPAYHLAYNDAILGVVIVPGFISFLGCLALPFVKPSGLPRASAWVVAGAGLVSLLSTVLWAIPMHDQLDRIGQDEATIASLLQANAVRTAALTVAAGTLTWTITRLVARRMRGSA